VRWTFARRGNFGFARTPQRIWKSGRSASPGFISAPNSAPLTVTVAVHNNIAATQLPNRGAATADIWLNAAGGVIAHRGRR
jgi:hypothetical protein